MDISRITSSISGYSDTQVKPTKTEPESSVGQEKATEPAAPPIADRFTSSAATTSAQPSAVASSASSSVQWTAETGSQKITELQSAILKGTYAVPAGVVADAIMQKMQSVVANTTQVHGPITLDEGKSKV